MNLPNKTLYPLGESILARRDHPDHGVIFAIREIVITTLITIVIALITLSNFSTAQALFGSDAFNLFPATFMYILLTFAHIYLARLVLLRAHLLAVCPITLYSEQVDPVQLVIHQIMKPPITIPLQGSRIGIKSQLKYFTKLTIHCRNKQSQGTLALLTPEEYRRFMAYWNAANPPIDAPSTP